MAWFLESLRQDNHWTFQSTWSHSWHALKEGSNKVPLTRIIKQHTKLLHMQNPWHESKPWRLHSADDELSEVEGHFALFPLMFDMTITIRVWRRPAMCSCTSVRADRQCTSSSVTEAILMAPFVEQHWVTMWQHVVVWQWQTSRALSTNCLQPYICCRTVTSNNSCFLLLLVFLWNGLLLLPCYYLTLTMILKVSLSDDYCLLIRKCGLM